MSENIHLFIYNALKYNHQSIITYIDSEGSMIIWSVFKCESERPVRISLRDSNTITSSNYTFLTVNLYTHHGGLAHSCRDIQSSNTHHGIGSSFLFSEKTNQNTITGFIGTLDQLIYGITTQILTSPKQTANGIESASLRLLIPRSLSSCITIGVV